jgi:hypothetical protein
VSKTKELQGIQMRSSVLGKPSLLLRAVRLTGRAFRSSYGRFTSTTAHKDVSHRASTVAARGGGCTRHPQVELDERGAVYWMVTLAGLPPPSRAAVRALLGSGRGGRGALACGLLPVRPFTSIRHAVRGVTHPHANGSCGESDVFKSVPLDIDVAEDGAVGSLGVASPLCERCPVIDSDTAYDVYVVAEDAAGNLGELSVVTFATPDVTPPTFVEGPPTLAWNGREKIPAAAASSAEQQRLGVGVDRPTPAIGRHGMATALLRLSATADEAGTVYGVVLPAGATPPSATEVRHPQLLQRHTVLLAAAQAAMVAEAAAAAVANATTPRLGGSSKPSAAVGTLEVRISCCCLCSMAFPCRVANATW